MTKIGITGSLASGKTTASKILSYKRGPLFCADSVVKQLYKNKNFKSKLSKKFKVKNNNQIKSSIKKLIFKDKSKKNEKFCLR
jgi:dephospho-CoA kinase